MGRFIKTISIYFLAAFILLYALQYLQERPKRVAVRMGLDKNLVKWNGAKAAQYNTIFIGSSRVYSSLDPVLFDSLTGLFSYNMGTGSQSLMESYYYLREVLKTDTSVRYVVLDLFMRSCRMIDYYQASANVPYLTGMNKMEFISQGCGARGIFNTFIPLLKHVGYIDIPSNAMYKPENHQGPNFSEWDRGFLRSIRSDTARKSDFRNHKIQEIDANTALIGYLEKIASLCRERNIELICTVIPASDVPNGIEIRYFEELTAKQGIRFFSAFPNLNSNDLKSDDFHQNRSGAHKTTTALEKYFHEQIIGPQRDMTRVGQ